MSTVKLSVYDGREPIAVITERRDGSWHVTVRDRHVGVVETREAALRLVGTTVNPLKKDIP